jgi:hypothetical protein
MLLMHLPHFVATYRCLYSSFVLLMLLFQLHVVDDVDVPASCC